MDEVINKCNNLHALNYAKHNVTILQCLKPFMIGIPEKLTESLKTHH